MGEMEPAVCIKSVWLCSLRSLSSAPNTPIFITTWDELNLWMCKWKSYLACCERTQWPHRLCTVLGPLLLHCCHPWQWMALKLSALAFITRSPQPFGSRTQISAFRIARCSDHSRCACFVLFIRFFPVVHCCCCCCRTLCSHCEWRMCSSYLFLTPIQRQFVLLLCSRMPPSLDFASAVRVPCSDSSYNAHSNWLTIRTIHGTCSRTCIKIGSRH